MSDMLQEGLDWLEEQRQDHMSRTVTYRRGISTVEIPATVAATRFEVDEGYGIIVKQQMRDYLIATAALVLDGEEVLPEPGDDILDEYDGVIQVYEVTPLGGEQHYRFCDPAQRTLRIHVKHIGTEP